MSINNLKNEIHKLIDKSENKYLLEFIFNVFSFSDLKTNEPFEDLWNSYSENQKELILKSFDQSESENNLLNHDMVISKIKNEI